MRALAAAAVLVLVASHAAQARVARSMGRSPSVASRLEPPRLWVERDGLFSLRRPASDLWRFDGTRRDTDGSRIPLVASSDETSATVSMQQADGVPSARELVRLLAERLAFDSGMRVDDPEPFAARDGGESYVFTFTDGQEARGRVAVVSAGEHLVLVVARWPLGSPAQVPEDVEAMIHSLGPAER
jgi:hypothetical protein